MQENPVSQKRKRNFNFTMGTYHGAEACELIRIFMLSLLGKHINKNHIYIYIYIYIFIYIKIYIKRKIYINIYIYNIHYTYLQ